MEHTLQMQTERLPLLLMGITFSAAEALPGEAIASALLSRELLNSVFISYQDAPR